MSECGALLAPDCQCEQNQMMGKVPQRMPTQCSASTHLQLSCVAQLFTLEQSLANGRGGKGDIELVR